MSEQGYRSTSATGRPRFVSVDAARSLGASNTRIICCHVLPNLVQAAMVIGTFAMETAIIAEASLRFLGLGVPPAIPT